MGAIWFSFRAEMRARWRAALLLTLLVGLTGGVVLAAVAGARRTDSAFTRLAEDSRTEDVLVNPDLGTESALDSRAVERLPEVEVAGRANGYFISPADARSEDDFARYGTILSSDGTAGYSFARPKVLEGRMPRPEVPDEVLVNPVLAEREHVVVGDRLDALGFSTTSVNSPNLGLPPGLSDEEIAREGVRQGLITLLRLHVTGIGVFPDQIVVDEGFDQPSMFLSPAFARAYPNVDPGFYGVEARLRAGARAVPEFRRAVEAMVPGEAIAFQTRTNTAAKVDRAVQPQVGALTIFAIVIALTGLLVIGQALARQAFLDSTDHSALHALGDTRRQLFGLAMLRVLPVALAGAGVAVLVALLLSPLTPIGPARTAEPDPGLRVDGFVLAAGLLAVAAGVLALAAVPAWRFARRRGDAIGAGEERSSRLLSALAGSGAPASALAGVRMAVEPGRGRTAVPVRTTIVSAMLAVAVVVAAVVGAASLDHLVETPRLYGWNWDLQVTVAPPGEAASEGDAAVTDESGAALIKVLETSPAIAHWAPISLSDVRLATGAVPALGIDPSRRIGPTLVSGRLPRRDDEIALGARTLRGLGASDDSVISARANDGTTRRLRVVGRVVLPGLGTYSGSDKTALGEGAVVTRNALASLGPAFADSSFLIAYRPDATGAEKQRFRSKTADVAAASADPGNFEVRGVQRPSDIVSYEKVRDTPIVLAGLLALLAAATVAHALVTSVRRRRRDFAMLKTLGFTRRQVSAAVAWQASTVGGVALLVGVPLGIVLGRWGWSALADNLGTVAEPIVPVIGVLLAIPVVLALVNLVAFVPGRVAARTQPAVALRSE